MKFVHIADVHLGKIIYSKNLLDIQIDLLNQVTAYLVEHHIDVLVIAGDIYDRAIASSESIQALNDFLHQIISVHHKKVLMVAGNHDSQERLNFASSLLKDNGLYIVAFPQKELKPIFIDGVNFYLVPFFKPSYIRYLYDKQDISTYQEAFAYYLSQQNIDYNQTNVLVTHQFIAGNQDVIQSESEVVLSVGGSEVIDVDLCKNFDYVALGHLHASQKIKYGHVRYAGSLMKYSFDEVKQTKGIVEVDIADKQVSIKTVTLKPKIDLIKVRGKFEDLLKNESNHHDYIAIELEDHQFIGHASQQLKNVYSHILQLTYPYLLQVTSKDQTKADFGFEKKSSLELFEEFYLKMKGEEMDSKSVEVIENLLKEGDQNDT